MSYEQIMYHVAGYIATITLNRPEKLNAWTPVMADEVRHAMITAATDEKVRVIILTGSGRGFCAGADMAGLKETAGRTPSLLNSTENPEEVVTFLTGTKTEEQRDEGNRFNTRSDFRKRYSYFPSIPKPVIAAINGPAFGIGLIIALYCDLRFASESARFSIPLAKRGLAAEHGISWLLPRIIGLSNALDLLFSGRAVDAQEASKLGLVNRTFPEDAFMTSVHAYATQLTTLVSPRSLRIMKKQVWEAQFQTLAEAAALADREMILSVESDDFKEGILHFLEKRSPSFSGK
jgi:enoyl-CoA hydratase/carnithine racemase